MRALLIPAMGLALLLAAPGAAQAQSRAPLPPALQAAIASCASSSASACEERIRQVVATLGGTNQARIDQLYVGALQALQTSLPANSPILLQVAANILPEISEANRGTVQALAAPPPSGNPLQVQSFQAPPPPVS